MCHPPSSCPETNQCGHSTLIQFVFSLVCICTDAVMDTSGSTRKLSQWPIFSLLDTNFLSGVKLACVFGSTGNEALVVSHNDEVYALGSNCSSCLGLGDTKNSFQPRKVETLCKQGWLMFNSLRGPRPRPFVAGFCPGH